MMKRYLGASVVYFGEKHACYMMRSRLAWFVKGLPHARHFRESIKHISTETGSPGVDRAVSGIVGSINQNRDIKV